MSVDAFRRRLAAQPHHVSAFLMLGDPTPEISVQLARAAVAQGCTMLELGFPFSDPYADGSAIQQACIRARAGGTSTRVAFDLLAQIRDAVPDVPLNLLVYANLVHARGYDDFCARAADAGAATLLVPDMTLEEAAPLRAAAERHELGHVVLVGPLTPPERVAQLDATSSGFVYLAGYQGVTGGGAAPAVEASAALVRQTLPLVQSPVCLGFGLSRREQIDAAFAAGAPMAVVGSHLARAIEAGIVEESGTGPDSERVLQTFGSALAPLTRPGSPSSSEIPRTDSISGS